MNRKTGYLLTACLFLTAYASTGVVQADTAARPAFVKDAMERTRECIQAYHDSHKAGLKNQKAGECSAACSRVYGHSLYDRPQDREKQLAQMERCTRAYNSYKSPEAAPAAEDELLRMPATTEEMASRMSAMKSRGLRNDPCVAGVKAIRRQQYNLEQAKRYWEGCAHNYKIRMMQQRINGGKL